jgi:hypothetical protein
MRKWVMRIVGALNLLLAALAVLYLEEMLRMHWDRWDSHPLRQSSRNPKRIPSGGHLP